MGVDIHCTITKYNSNDNLFHEVKLYNLNSEGCYHKVNLYPYRNNELFSILQQEKDDIEGIDFPSRKIRVETLDTDMKDYVVAAKSWGYGFFEVSLASLDAYCSKVPTVKNYDAPWPEDENGFTPENQIPRKENPVIHLFNKTLSYIAFAEGWGPLDSELADYKLLYWFDC